MSLINLMTTLSSQYTINKDADNKVTDIRIVLNENFTTTDFDIMGNADIVFDVQGLLGSGTLTYQKSIDRVNWFNELNDAQTGNLTIALTTTALYNLVDKKGFTGWRRFAYVLNSVLGGTVGIKVQNV